MFGINAVGKCITAAAGYKDSRWNPYPCQVMLQKCKMCIIDDLYKGYILCIACDRCVSVFNKGT